MLSGAITCSARVIWRVKLPAEWWDQIFFNKRRKLCFRSSPWLDGFDILDCIPPALPLDAPLKLSYLSFLGTSKKRNSQSKHEWYEGKKWLKRLGKIHVRDIPDMVKLQRISCGTWKQKYGSPGHLWMQGIKTYKSTLPYWRTEI